MTELNGHANGSSHPIAEGDAIIAPTIAQLEEMPRVVLCCKRLPDGHGWCLLPDGHPPPCEGVKSAAPPSGSYGPTVTRKRTASTAPPIVCAAPPPPPTDAEIAQTIEQAQKALSNAQKGLETALALLHPDIKVK